MESEGLVLRNRPDGLRHDEFRVAIAVDVEQLGGLWK